MLIFCVILVLVIYMEKILLVDGNNILFRSYYATAYNGNVMKNSKGFPTNALYGFVNMMNKIIEEENPTYIMVAFDKGKTFRHEMYADYKGGRQATPDELKVQFPVSRELCKAMGLAYYEIDNYEADDIIGTFAKQCNDNKEYNAVIISSDKDLLQLITDDVEVKLLKTHDYIRMTKEEFEKTYGIEPPRMVDLKSLMGDSSDNIPGVKGVGEKTALELLHTYGSLDNIYEQIDSVKGKLKEKLEADKESAYNSYKLATIYKDVPIDTDIEKIKYNGYDPLKFIEILEDLEFYSLLKKLDIKKEDIDVNIQKEEESKFAYKIVNNIEEIKLDSNYSVYLEMLGYNYHKADLLGLSIYNGKEGYFVPLDLLKNNYQLLFNKYEKYTYDLKKVLVLLKRNNLEINNCNYDLMISSYLLNKNVKDDISYLMKNDGISVPLYEEEFGTEAKLHMIDINEVAEIACKKAKYIYDTYENNIKALEEENCTYLFNEVEMPLVSVLADMEITGIRVDKDYLLKMGEEIKDKMDSLEKEIYSDAGEEFNISSPKQLADILFVKMGLPYPKKVKDGYSTSKEILDKIAPFSPIIGKIEDYRMYSKLYSSYITGLIAVIYPDGRCHTIYNQTLTRTGRLSSQEPNLQNIPIRLDYGKLIRKAFVPEENSIIMSSDYSQIELRVFASMCKEQNLIDAFKEGKDIHAKTASDIYHKPIEEVTKDERRNAKAVNFGIIYGISSFGLSEDLGIDFTDAKEFIDNYLDTFPGIREFRDKTIRDAHERGYALTLLNRKRVIDELNNKNYMIRQQGERMALNTPIQGTAADILKIAMVKLYKELNDRNLKSKMLVQVHDELVLNVYKDEEEEVEKLVREVMENAYELDVPLLVDVEKGDDWYDAK